MINALKLLANQQEDGNGLLRDIVTNLGKGSTKGLTDGLRDFIKVENHRALDVGELHRGTGTVKVRKPKVEGGSDVTTRESPHELTSKAEEVNTSKAYIDVNHIKRKDGALPWLMLAGVLSARLCIKASKDDSYKIMSKAVGVKKAQKARGLWAMKAAKDKREDFL